MKYQKFFHFLQNVGKDPSAIFFEDELTRLKNRRFLLNYFKNEIDWQGFKPPVSLLLIDIDHFKRLNEQYGEEAGDQALVHVSTILKDTARETQSRSGMPGMNLSCSCRTRPSRRP